MTQIATILSYGVVMAPGLVVDGTVRIVGFVPGLDEVKQILTTEVQDEFTGDVPADNEGIITREEY